MKGVIFVVILITGILMIGCNETDFQEVEVELEATNIDKITFVNGTSFLELESPFDSNTREKIDDIINHISSLTFYEDVIDDGYCDGSEEIAYNLYTKDGNHYELYTVSVSQNDACTNYLVISKNAERVGYAETGSETLYNLFSDLS